MSILVYASEELPLPLTVEAAAKTDIGLVRRSNQDSFGAFAPLGLYVVCDGMGGAAGGDLASSIAVETFLAIARQELESIPGHGPHATCEALRRAAASANRAVVQRAAWDTRFRGMGSTLVAARITPPNLVVVNVGDSRAYLFRAAHPTQITQITQITEDHSWVAEQIKLGLMTPQQAAASGRQSVITRAIGADTDVLPDLFTLTLQPGDAVLLTSDGLTRYVDPDELAALITATAHLTPEAACLQLIDLAKSRGGADNITCLLLRLTEA